MCWNASRTSPTRRYSTCWPRTCAAAPAIRTSSRRCVQRRRKCARARKRSPVGWALRLRSPIKMTKPCRRNAHPTRSNPELIPSLATLEHRQEQLLKRKPPRRQALLVGKSRQHVERLAVLFREAVFPRIGAEDVLLLFQRGLVPGERHDARVLHPLDRDRLRL